jgi:putative transposase
MGRVASAGDNAAMESWHTLLHEERPRSLALATHGELHQAIVFWIEHTYSRRRRQRALGKLTPVQYELAFTTQAAVAE